MDRKIAWLMTGLACAGCVKNEYQIELTPKGEKLERKFRVDRRENDAPEKIDAETARLTKEYGQKLIADKKSQRTGGTFAGRLPNDVGGHGTYTRFESPLGTAAVYVERFRGDDDLAGLLERRKSAVDHVVGLLIGWLGTELKNDPRWPTFQKFLHEEFRRDLFNLSLQLLIAPRTELKEGRQAAVALGIFQYLIEHGYLTAEELPEWQRATEDLSREKYDRLFALYRRLILKRFDDGRQPPPELKFLESRTAAETSLRKFLRTTEEYGIARDTWLEKRLADPNLAEPDPLDVIGSVAKENLQGILQLGGDHLNLRLNLDRPAIYTNGVKVDQSELLEWDMTPLPNREMPPELVYAVWDEPNELAQKLIFGETALAGEAMLKYCLWYRGLTDAERTAWDDFLATLQPGPELLKRIEAFRFPGELAESQALLVKPAAEAITGGLKKKPPEEGATP